MNIKWYHVFLISLIFVAIAFAGVIGGSFRGAGTKAEHFAQAAPSAPSPTTPSAPLPPGTTLIELTAKNTAYDKRSVSATANQPVTVRFTNQDAGVTHNVAFYRSKSSVTQPLVSGSKADIVTGPGSTQFTFTAPAAGTYYYQCDIHPDQMNGSFVVR